jgi:protein-S-isoprenylcysteine O-methyltransferase Ste14
MKEISKLSDLAKIIAATLQFFIICILISVALFVSSGTFNWTSGWLFVAVYSLSSLISMNILYFNVPELMDERKKSHPNAKKWDRFLVTSYEFMYFPILILSGLDKRFGYTGMPISTVIISLILILFSFLLMTWAPLVNKHLETYIRIQTDRDHSVCDKGPYTVIRHPTYLALILLFIAMPVSLGSIHGLIPAILAIIIVCIRTSLEDRVLNKELLGYREYSKKVKYRLIPYVWIFCLLFTFTIPI